MQLNQAGEQVRAAVLRAERAEKALEEIEAYLKEPRDLTQTSLQAQVSAFGDDLTFIQMAIVRWHASNSTPPTQPDAPAQGHTDAGHEEN